MNQLPNELIIEIFNYIQKITDKRQFLRTCNHFNNITKQSMLNYENNNRNNYKNPYIFKTTKYCVENFTLELCDDSYFNLIPDHYITRANKILMECLACYNCIFLLEKAKLKGCSLKRIINEGALGGHLEVIQYGIENGYSFSVWTCANAALCGHVNLLKWLHENGCEWDHWTTAYAATRGHIEALKYAYINGCKMNTVYSLKLKPNKEIEYWLTENGYPYIFDPYFS